MTHGKWYPIAAVSAVILGCGGSANNDNHTQGSTGGSTGLGGGTSATGGAATTGGSEPLSQHTGGFEATGGKEPTGGMAYGGNTSTIGTGGTTGTGGSTATGGKMGTGGKSATGGWISVDGGASPVGGFGPGGAWPVGGGGPGGAWPTGGAGPGGNGSTGGAYPVGGNGSTGGAYPVGGNGSTGGYDATGGEWSTGGGYNVGTGGGNSLPSCTPGADQTCNDDPTISALWGHCEADAWCTCNGDLVVNPSTGKCNTYDQTVCYSPTQLIDKAYVDRAFGCTCNYVSSPPFCGIDSSGLRVYLECTSDNTWQSGSTSNCNGSDPKVCFSPTKNVSSALLPNAIGCSCNATTSTILCGDADAGVFQPYKFTCTNGRWTAVAVASCT
jgi:hypothetical protein